MSKEKLVANKEVIVAKMVEMNGITKKEAEKAHKMYWDSVLWHVENDHDIADKGLLNYEVNFKKGGEPTKNPKTGEPTTTKDSYKVKHKVGSKLKHAASKRLSK